MFNTMLHADLYGNFRTRYFKQIFPDQETFYNEYQSSALVDGSIADSDLALIYYYLYATYGNSHIANADENQFKYRVWATINMYAPTWIKRLDIQKKVRELNLEEDFDPISIYNHAYNPGTAPTTSTTEELTYINEQNTNRHKRSEADKYAMILALLETDVTKEFLDKFKPLFLKLVYPELPLYYETEVYY